MLGTCVDAGLSASRLTGKLCVLTVAAPVSVGFFISIFCTCLSVSVVASHEFMCFVSKKKKSISILQFCAHVYTYTCMFGYTYVETRRQLAGVGSLYHVVPWGSNSDLQFWRQALFYPMSQFTGP